MEHGIADALRAEAAAYYERKLLAHGPTARGVDWNSESSQRLRFEQLLRVIAPDAPAGTVIDYGCGYGALADYHLWHAARADLLRRLGRRDEAAAAYRRALALVGSEPERRFLDKRLQECS